MNIFKNSAFWDWLYSSGNKPLSKKVFVKVKSDFNYRIEKIVSELDGKSYTWNFETILIDLPINSTYSICSLIQLNGTADFEENIYLKSNNAYYALGWIDSHSHEMIFRVEEFHQVIDFLKNSLATDIHVNTYILFLSRFVTLTNQDTANQLIKDCIASYTQICNGTDTIIPKITKSSLYGKKIYGTDWVVKIKTIRAPKHPFRFTINEGISWIAEKDRFNLHGFGAHSMRNKHFDGGLLIPVDIYNVKTSLDDYSFPYVLWNDLLNETDPKQFKNEN